MAEYEILDIIARMIDPPIQSFEEEESITRKHIRRKFAQLPWALEYALVRSLSEKREGWFRGKINNPVVDCTDAIFSPGSETDYHNADPYYQRRPSYILEYTFSDLFIKEFSDHETGDRTRTVSKPIEEWMKDHGLYETADDNPDPHFAERAFIVNVLVPGYGSKVLSSITPQKFFEDMSYQVDFFINTPRERVVVEVDGREYHDPVKIGADRFEYELKRQNRIQSLGHMVFRYPARRILQEPDSVIDEMKNNIPIIGAGQFQLFGSADSGEHDGKEILETSAEIDLIEEYCKWFRPMQLALLLALSNAGGKEQFQILARNSPAGLTYFAMIDLGLLVHQACRLYGVSLSLPQCVNILISEDTRNSGLYSQIRQYYLEAVSRGPEGFDPIGDFLPFSLQESTEEAPNDKPELVIDLAREGRIPLLPEGMAYPDVLGFESASISTLRARLKAMTLERPGPRNSLRPKNLEKCLLDYFARRFLRIPYLYHHYDPVRPNTEQRQYELVRRVLQAESVLGIMPTGHGKSVAFQLPAMLLPGGALVISPLRALMRDQLEDLRYCRGFNSVESIRYDMTSQEKDEAIDDFLKGFTNLLYVSPERLQVIKFSTMLANVASQVHISFLAIDEAHCVSEWGHDFRLSYLHIPIFLDKLNQQQQDRNIPILALTATATPPVRCDVCSILALRSNDARKGGNLVAEANVDRTELSFSVHPVVGNSYPEDRQKILIDVLTKSLPHALDYRWKFLWPEFSRSNWHDIGTGIIYCIYARPLGQTSWQDGVGAIHDTLLIHRIIPKENMRFYAADSPYFCPECEKQGFHTYAIRNKSKSLPDEDDTTDFGNYECANGHNFSMTRFHEDWSNITSQIQHDFKDKAFPLLVSTKAFGMGIDHRAIRFIVHYGFSSSIESYYQEVGRAGRDRQHAHCALITRLPHEQCLKDYIDSGDLTLPPCMSGVFFKRRVCPPEIGLPEPCDFSRQLRLVLDYYIKPGRFAKKSAVLWKNLMLNASRSEGQVEWRVCGGGPGGNRRLQSTQNCLFRLQQIGLVKRFMLKYAPHRTHRNKKHLDVIFNVWMNENPHISTMLQRLEDSLVNIWNAPLGNLEESQRVSDISSRIKAKQLIDKALGSFEVQDDNPPTQEQVELAVLTLFNEVRNYVLRMRIISLRNLIVYVLSNDTCRRKQLLGAMTGQEKAYASDTHACNFCDSKQCVPDLAFSQELATTAADSGQHQDIFAAQEDSFRVQNFSRLKWALHEAQDQKLVAAFGQKAAAHLEFDPNNPAANFAAAESYARNPDPNLQRSAHFYYKQFARVANVESKDTEQAKLGYSHYREFSPTEAIRTYARSESVFDTLENISLLDTDSEKADLHEEERLSIKLAHYGEQYKKTITVYNKDADLQDALSTW